LPLIRGQAICKFRMTVPRDNPDRLAAARPGSQIKTKT
jgi:hypothetical protein